MSDHNNVEPTGAGLFGPTRDELLAAGWKIAESIPQTCGNCVHWRWTPAYGEDDEGVCVMAERDLGTLRVTGGGKLLTSFVSRCSEWQPEPGIQAKIDAPGFRIGAFDRALFIELLETPRPRRTQPPLRPSAPHVAARDDD